MSPDLIEKAFVEYLEAEKVQYTKHEKKYKTKFIQKGKDSEGEEYEIHMVMRITQVNDESVCVEFQKSFGDAVRFSEYFKTYMTSVLSVFDDTTIKS